MKKILKWLAVVLMVPVCMFLLLTALLYCPPVQNWAAKAVASYASEKTGMDVRVGEVRLAFPLDLEINSFLMLRKSAAGATLHHDTIADVKRLVVDVAAWPLFRKQVEINALELSNAKINTVDFIPSARIKGEVGRLFVQSRGIDLSKETVRVNEANLENALLDVALSDTVPPDTTKSEGDWKIDIDALHVTRTGFTLHMPGDTMSVKANMDKAVAKNTRLELKDGVYQVLHLDWNGGSLNYDQNFVKPSTGFDGSHIAMTDLQLGVDSFRFSSPNLYMSIREAQFREKSGLHVLSLSSRFMMDDKQLSLPDMKLKTTQSQLAAHYAMDLNAFADQQPGRFYADVDGYLGKSDIMAFIPSLPSPLMNHWPNRPLSLKGKAEGNLQYLTFKNLSVKLPTVMDLTGTGWVANPLDTNRLRANIHLKGKTENLDMVASMLPKDVQSQVKLPVGMGIDGKFKANGSEYGADFTLTEGGGSIRATGTFDAQQMAYRLKASAKNLPLQHFLPGMSLNPFTGDISLKGKGTDFLNPKTGLTMNVNIRQFRYGNYQLDGLGGDVSLHNGLVHAKINSTNPMLAGRFNVDGKLTSTWVDIHFKGLVSQADLRRLGVMDKAYLVRTDADVYVKSDLKNNHSIRGHVGDFALHEQRSQQRITLVNGDFTIDAQMKGKSLNGHFDGLIHKADFYQMGVFDQPFAASFGANLQLNSNLNDFYSAQGHVCNLSVQENGHYYHPGDLDLDLLTRKDTTHAVINSGDFMVNLAASGGYQRLMNQSDLLTKTLQKQIKNKHIDQEELWQKLPDGHLYLRSGTDNLLTSVLRQMGYRFSEADLDVKFSPQDGINGTGRVLSLVMMKDSITLDTLGLSLFSNDNTLNYDLRVANNRQNAYPIKAHLDGSLYEKGALSHVIVKDAQNRTGLDLGLKAGMDEQGWRINVVSDHSVIGYKNFVVNNDNYIFIGNDSRVSADMRMVASDGTGVHIYTDDEDTDALQNLTLSMNRFELGDLCSVIPFAPRVSGVLDGDFHVIQTRQDLTVSSDLTVKNMVYEGSAMGNVGTQLVYMPKSDGSHYVDAIILKDNHEVGLLSGVYKSEGEGFLDANFEMNRFPLHYVNGFIPDRIIGLRGTGEGKLTMKGPISKLNVNGEVYLDSSYVFSEPYGVELRFANDPVRITNSKLLFENFEMFANNNSPLNIMGSLDFSDMNKMMLDIRMRARNFLLVDAKENIRSEAYGKAYVNFFGRMQGPLNQLNLRGRLDVLGNTDMTYVLKESSLATDNSLDELVKFVNLDDSTSHTVVTRPDITGFKMDMNIKIDEQAHIVCALNADHSNYIDLIGGGDLRMKYDPTNDIQLQGRYTLSNGEMKYALPVIPLRTFNIQTGSFVEFTGDPMNPTLNILATERIKTNVYDNSSSGRMVAFDCGVKLTQTMSKPSIQFVIEAPEDMQIQNELNTKSMEERGKLAVSMLASGMYLDENNSTANTAMNGALASFMQSEINSITGNALRSMGIDLSANMETAANASGGLHTDYTFRFSKRLWNNRLRIIMGGRVSTGSEVGEENGAFFDNFSMEYRLNQNETQYLKLFYERDSYDWLEGSISEFGAGFMWRRKLDSLIDIFNFKKSSQNLMGPRPQRTDTVPRTQNTLFGPTGNGSGKQTHESRQGRTQ